jgi:hypothetical protein
VDGSRCPVRQDSSLVGSLANPRMLPGQGAAVRSMGCLGQRPIIDQTKLLALAHPARDEVVGDPQSPETGLLSQARV